MSSSQSDHVPDKCTRATRHLALRVGAPVWLCLASALIPAGVGARPLPQGSSPSDGTPIEEPEFAPYGALMATNPESLAAPEATSAAVLSRLTDRIARAGWRIDGRGGYEPPVTESRDSSVRGRYNWRRL